ncbi:MAG: glycosyltransferase [Proteiniphilum sp.]|nr:glycosyltransferase [Proteiniphilum sp.]MDD4800308.1 glycosyltransferase [Proteiniphilum sp.]
MYFSIVIPLYNRPDELDELLASLCEQTDKQFEVILAEDGSTQKSDHVAERYRDRLSITYFEKPNTGPGLTRNEGAARASGDYLIFFDSDCIIPAHYMEQVSKYLARNDVDAYGGPDAALPTFTTIQKAINYAMTSFFTTGGIRGGKRSMEKFHPRSFNLGVSQKAFEALGGYGTMRFGEDIDFSLRLMKQGFRTALIPEAYVYHKRRTSFRQFFRQVYNSGIARINLHLAHPGSLRAVHTLPALFVITMTLILLTSLLQPFLLLCPLLYSLVIFLDSLGRNRSAKVALYSIAAAWIQLTGYGSGFIAAVWKRLILKKGEFSAFEKKFYD